MQRVNISETQGREHHHNGVSFPIIVLLLYLAGITIIGKGTTYLGIYPIYWGEVTLLLMVGWMLWRISAMGVSSWFFHILGLLVLLFIIFNAIRTIPGVFSYHLLALRDAASWYYAILFFIGLQLASEHRTADWIWKWLVRIWLLAMIWTIFSRMSGQYLIRIGPMVRNGTAYLLGGSGSENAQHMVLGGVILLLGLGQKQKRRMRGIRYLVELGLILLVFFYLFITTGRGVKVAMLFAIVITVVLTIGKHRSLWPASRWFAIAYLFILGIGLFAIYAGPSGLRNYIYIKGDVAHIEEGLQIKGTANWRSIWWSEILDDVRKKNPAFGLGYGISFGEYNPHIRKGLQPHIRSPHNYNVTILGRTGFIGFSLWIGILVVGIGQLLWRTQRGGIRGKSYTLERNKELAFWSIFLIATWLNSSFGVLMEGPVLGIWFWFGLGFATGRSLDPHGLESPATEEEELAPIVTEGEDAWWLNPSSAKPVPPLHHSYARRP